MKSQNGWPISQNHDIGIKSFIVPGTGIQLRCAEAVAPLLVGLAAEFHKYIEPIDEGQPDDWGYAHRMIRADQKVWSNHASGTAIDLNSKLHPLGKVGTFDAKKVPMIRALAKKYGCIWGGDYKNRKDEMHFEIAIDATKAAALIEKLNGAHK